MGEESNLKEVLLMLEHKLLVARDVIGLTADWQIEIVDDEVICASAHKEKSILDVLFHLLLPNLCGDPFLVLLQILHLLPHRKYILTFTSLFISHTCTPVTFPNQLFCLTSYLILFCISLYTNFITYVNVCIDKRWK